MAAARSATDGGVGQAGQRPDDVVEGFVGFQEEIPGDHHPGQLPVDHVEVDRHQFSIRYLVLAMHVGEPTGDQRIRGVIASVGPMNNVCRNPATNGPRDARSRQA